LSDRFEELVGDIADPAERERLRRVHELLLSVEGPPELPAVRDPAPVPAPVTVLPQRRRYATVLIAAALALALFGSGYLVGGRSDVEAVRVIPMAGVNDGRGASASIDLLPQDAEENGNWPMNVSLRGLEPSRDRQDFYELWLTKDGKPVESCGRFTIHSGLTTVTLSVPYGLRRYDGWVVTRRGSDEILLTT
jgi:hypothetical protein